MGTERLSTWAHVRAPSPGFSCVSVDTRLFDVEACVLLRELLMGGLVELKRPDGSVSTHSCFRYFRQVELAYFVSNICLRH